MRRASENLYRDHHFILIALDAIDRALWHAARGQRSIEFFELGAEFVTVYADGAHYEKEELLFQAVIAAPMPPAAVPVGCLLMEHDSTRAQGERIRAGLAAIRAGNEAEWFTVMDAFFRYSAIIRVHLPKENNGFFPMSDQVLSPDVQAELVARFDAIDGALPSTIEAIAAALHQPASPAANAGPTAVVPGRVEKSHTDKYTMYDDRLAASLEKLQVTYRRY